jgi:hypothetical protein
MIGALRSPLPLVKAAAWISALISAQIRAQSIGRISAGRPTIVVVAHSRRGKGIKAFVVSAIADA